MQVLRNGETEQLTCADIPNITILHLDGSHASSEKTSVLRTYALQEQNDLNIFYIGAFSRAIIIYTYMGLIQYSICVPSTPASSRVGAAALEGLKCYFRVPLITKILNYL
jgi:hypothetical protein